MDGIKYDGEKPKMHLLPPKAIVEISKVLTFGAAKYDAENWRKLDDLQNNTRLVHFGTYLHTWMENSSTQKQIYRT